MLRRLFRQVIYLAPGHPWLAKPGFTDDMPAAGGGYLLLDLNPSVIDADGSLHFEASRAARRGHTAARPPNNRYAKAWLSNSRGTRVPRDDRRPCDAPAAPQRADDVAVELARSPGSLGVKSDTPSLGATLAGGRISMPSARRMPSQLLLTTPASAG
jgi:hypothetical protein